MTADERVSILYYEICCSLLHRWNFDRSNVKADMNEMCRQCGATYDELRSILKHLRTKYLQPFRESVRTGPVLLPCISRTPRGLIYVGHGSRKGMALLCMARRPFVWGEWRGAQHILSLLLSRGDVSHLFRTIVPALPPRPADCGAPLLSSPPSHLPLPLLP